MKCKNCGAEISHASAKCDFCGSTNAILRKDDGQAVFERIKQSPEYQQRDSVQRRATLPTIGMFQKIFPIVFFVVFIGFAATMAIGAFLMVGVGAIGMQQAGGFIPQLFAIVPMTLSIVPSGFVILGVILLTKTLKKNKEFEGSPVVAQPAIVTGKRMQVSGGGNNTSTSTHYFLTCEMEDGRRTEFRTMTPRLYSQVVENDPGVLYTRTDIALDFDRVEM